MIYRNKNLHNQFYEKHQPFADDYMNAQDAHAALLKIPF